MADNISALKAKLAARKGKPGFKDNSQELRDRIENLESRK